MSFKGRRILVKKFVESQFEVMYVYGFIKNSISYEDICWVSIWNYLSLRVSNKSEFLWRHLLTLSLKLCKFMSFKQNRILMEAFVEPQFGVMSLYEFKTKANSDENICFVSLWSYVSLWVSRKSGFLWRDLLSISLELCKFMSSKQNPILTKTNFR